MPIVRMRVRQLSSGERADLEAALKDPARFHSDGREVTIACVVLPLLLLPLEIVLVYGLRGSDNPLAVFDHFVAWFPGSLSILWSTDFLELAAPVVLPLAIVA